MGATFAASTAVPANPRAIAAKRAASGLRSPVGWALLGLVIQRASYGYELMQRFERTYGDALELSSVSQIYASLDTLERHGLIDMLTPAPPAEVGRQPKLRYRATAEGVRAYRAWLISQLDDRRKRSHLFVVQLAMLPPREALAVIAECERDCLAHARRAKPPRTTPAEAESDASAGLAARLLLEQDRLAAEGKLAWIEYARRELIALARARPSSAPAGTSAAAPAASPTPPAAPAASSIPPTASPIPPTASSTPAAASPIAATASPIASTNSPASPAARPV